MLNTWASSIAHSAFFPVNMGFKLKTSALLPNLMIDSIIYSQDQDLGITAPQLWLATSADRRVSVWSADWSKDFCELVDWLTFPAPAFTPEGAVISKKDQVNI